MTAVLVPLTSRPAAKSPEPAERQPLQEPAGLIIVADVENLTEGAACNDDNPYQG
ncbi:hypothetical protein ACWGKQ_14070 [Streptomyces sp. NPDC054770]